MNIKDTLSGNKKKTVVVGGIAAVLVLGAGGAAIAGVAGNDNLRGGDRDRAGEAALEHVGKGEVTDAERGDDDDVEAYEVEVTRPDGSEVDVKLDQDFTVIDSDDDRDDSGPDADDRRLSEDERTKAAEAARAKVPGTVHDVEASDDRIGDATAAYEVEVVTEDGIDWDVWLDDQFTVIDSRQD
ncbi:PepSY domain-containing protein [Aeromicrobium piscarium]|uniref:PepSY domain-containing protein n=1 Tax=Aeromicrobium piscarium TaxID=2590901 RepID=A0A554RHM9_9ACTN|nr:PepSY domain-containing protein [Aeromicrobium piscarium]TSD53673.1 PepSY domain-containing protein [Aeromicrobium piscarium]